MANNNIVYHGDSITLGYLLDAPTIFSYPAQVNLLLGATWTGTTVATFGATFAGANADAVTNVDPLISGAAPRNVLVGLWGSNDIALGTTAATLEGIFQTYWTNRQTAGWTERIATTILPRIDLAAGPEAERVAYNSWVRANYATYCTKLVDFDNDTRISTIPTYLYYRNGEGVHPNFLGAACVAGDVFRQLGVTLTAPHNVASLEWGADCVASSTLPGGYTAGFDNGWAPQNVLCAPRRIGVPWAGGDYLAVGSNHAQSGGGWNDNDSGTFPKTFEVDFAASETVDTVNIFSVQDGVGFGAPGTEVEPTLTTTFTLYGLVDFLVQAWTGAAWSTVVTVTGNNKVWYQGSFTAVTTTKMRVSISATADGVYGRLTGFEVLTAPTSSGALLVKN